MWVFDAETLSFVDVNEAALQKYGYSREQFLEKTILDVRPAEECPAFLRSIKADLATEIRPQGIWKHRKKDGTAMEVEITASLVTFNGRASVLSLVHDVTAHRLLEEQLRQSQKMEAVGLLAGGIAHDFNNLLNVILGYLQLIPDNPGDVETLNRYLTKATDATRRASDLVRQLLALSRKQVLWPRVLCLNTVVSELGRVLPRMLGENIEIVVQEADDLGRIKVDESQIEQVVLNIAVNARDAMPNGGTLTITTCNHTFQPEEPLAHTMPAGPYVLLNIADTGTGMDAKTLSHIFEPFFTTKAKGKGSGLGLAIVYGIVTQSGGYLHVTSAPGKGTSFEIFFPRVSDGIEAAHGGSPQTARVEKEKLESTILLVEDEDALRDATFEFLTHTGCHVLTAHDGCEALTVLQHTADPVRVLVTDVVMPKMGGDELARQVRHLYPEIKIIFVSGYNDELVSRSGVLDSATTFLPKPYTFRDLAEKIREASSASTN
jgi:two-component system cell cycle sensor histidine kinase/response regulator CckA